MSRNPFNDALDAHFRGEYVSVDSSDLVGPVKGWVDRVHHHEQHVLLRDAVTPAGARTPVALVPDASAVTVVDPPEDDDRDERIERVPLDAVQAALYHEREFEESANRGYVADVRDDGFVGSFPVVREVGYTTGGGVWTDGRADAASDAGPTFEVVEGHKRIWACRQAGLDAHPVEVVDVDDWTAARRFAADHYPDPGQLDGSQARGVYDDAALSASLHTFVEQWGDRATELSRVRFNLERLGLDAWDGGLDTGGTDGE